MYPQFDEAIARLDRDIAELQRKRARVAARQGRVAAAIKSSNHAVLVPHRGLPYVARIDRVLSRDIVMLCGKREVRGSRKSMQLYDGSEYTRTAIEHVDPWWLE